MTTDRGLYLCEPKSHSSPRHIPEDDLFAPVAISPTTQLHVRDPTPQEVETTNLDRSATTDTLWYKDYRPQTYARGNRRSGRDDDWFHTSGGKYAIQVYVRPRRTMFIPGMPITGQKGEPRLVLLGEARTTRAVSERADHILVHYDDCRTADSSHRLPEARVGETIFEIAATMPRASAASPTGPCIPLLPLDTEGDY